MCSPHECFVSCSVRSVVFNMCLPQMILSISECPANCDLCDTDGSNTKCLLSGCQQGYTRKSDGTCAGESVSAHSANVLVHQCVY